MKKMLMLGAIVAATAGFAAPETAQAEHCYSGYSGYGRVGYSSGYNYAPRSYSYSAPRYYSGSRYGGSHYGHGHSYSNYGGRGYGNSYGHGHSYGRGYGGFGIGVRTRGFSFSYRR
jgi:peroxin-13